MQRFIAVRVLQSLLALVVMSMIVFGLARISGNPLDVMLPIEALPEDYERLEKHWGRSSSILNNGGDRVRISSFRGVVVGCYAYGSASC